MQHPWGLSGPDFLWLYAVGLVVGVVVTVVARMAVRRPRLAEPPGPVAPEELGFLAGGPRHAVQVAVARLVRADLVRVDRGGHVTATADGRRTGHPLDDAVLATLSKPRKVSTVAEKVAEDQVVAEIGESLVRRGLLVDPARSIRAWRLPPIVLYVLFVIGVVRWVNGVANQLPVNYLTFLLAATFVLCGYLSFRAAAAPKARTVHGDRVIAEVKARGKAADPLDQVAVTGLSAYPDREFSRALSAGATVLVVGGAWSYASAASFGTYVHTASSGGGSSSYDYSSSSDSSSSGGGCGGGGCGGGTS